MQTGNILIVTAPSGTGKTTLVAALLSAEHTVQLSISNTTRLPREGEIDGRHYHFVDRNDFEQRIVNGEFLEYAEVYGNYYGTSIVWLREQLRSGNDILLEIDWQGAEQVRKVFPQAVSIFILPPSIDELERRLRGRGTDSDEVIAHRLAMVQDEISHAGNFDYLIVNDDLGRATLDLISVVRAERLRPARQTDILSILLNGN